MDTTLPFALTARKVLARPVMAKFVVVALVVVDIAMVTPWNVVEAAVQTFPVLRFMPQLLTVALPLYELPVKVLLVERLLRLFPRDMPLMVELARYELLIDVVADTAPLVPNRRPVIDATDRPPVVVVPVTVWNPVVVRLDVEALARVVWPVTLRKPLAETFVVEALANVELPDTARVPVAVILAAVRFPAK